jgi:uncharacterized protein (DUF427 family)
MVIPCILCGATTADKVHHEMVKRGHSKESDEYIPYMVIRNPMLPESETCPNSGENSYYTSTKQIKRYYQPSRITLLIRKVTRIFGGRV